MSDQTQGRVPPQAVEVEQSILGSILLEPDTMDKVSIILNEDDFYKPAHRDIYLALKKLHQHAEPLDAITLENELKDQEKLDMIGGEGYLHELTRHVGSAANAEYYCQIVKEKSLKRHLILSCSEIIKSAYDTTEDAGYVIDKAQAAIFALTETRAGSMMDLEEVIMSVFQVVDKIQESGKPIGLRTGLDIDDILQGFQNGKLYMLGARPSMGKTALALTIMRRLALDNIKPGIISLETTHQSLGTRLIAQVSGLATRIITGGQMNESQVKQFIQACEALSQLGMIIDDQEGLTSQQVRSKCRLMKKKGAQVIFVDFLTLISGDDTRNKHLEVGGITKMLKNTAKELNIPIICLAQLSRSIENRNDKRPQMSDLRESGSIEEDADVIMFLYRPEYYGVEVYLDGSSTAGIAEVIIAKNKDGQTGFKKQQFIPEAMKFENFSRIPEPDRAPQPHWTDDESGF